MKSGNLNKRFGQRVQTLRKQRGLTQAELAATIGRSEDMIGNVERGAASTRLTTTYEIARALDVTVAELFDFGDPPKRDREHQKVLNDIISLLNRLDFKTVRKVRLVLSQMFEVAE